MDPVVGAILAGGGQLAGGVANYFGQKEANEQNMEMFKSNQQFQANAITSAMDYNTAMSNTAHQREVADLKAAGLNPVISAMGGSGASSPTAPTGNPGVGNAAQNENAGIGQAISGAVSSAMQAMSTIENVKNTQADTAKKTIEAVAENARAQRETQNAHYLEEQTNFLAGENARRTSENIAIKEEAKTREEKAKIERNNMALDKLLQQIGQGSGAVRNATDALTNIINPLRWLRPRGGYSERDMLDAAKGKGVLLP